MVMAETPAGAETRTAVLAAIAKWWREHEYAPSIRDLCSLTGIASSSTISYHLVLLRDQHLILRDADTSRSLRLTREGWALVGR